MNQGTPDSFGLADALGMALRTTDIPRQALLRYSAGLPIGDALGQVVDPEKVLRGQDVIQRQLPELINYSPALAAGLGTLLELADPLTAVGALLPTHVNPEMYDAWHATTRPGPVVPQPPQGIHIGTKGQAVDRTLGLNELRRADIPVEDLTPEKFTELYKAQIGGTDPARLVPVRAQIPKVAGPFRDWSADQEARRALGALQQSGYDATLYRNAAEDPGAAAMSALVFDPSKVTLRDPAAGPAMESLYGQAKRGLRDLGERGGALKETDTEREIRNIKAELDKRSYGRWQRGPKQDFMTGDLVSLPGEPRGSSGRYPLAFEVKSFPEKGTARLLDPNTGEMFDRPVSDLHILQQRAEGGEIQDWIVGSKLKTSGLSAKQLAKAKELYPNTIPAELQDFQLKQVIAAAKFPKYTDAEVTMLQDIYGNGWKEVAGDFNDQQKVILSQYAHDEDYIHDPQAVYQKLMAAHGSGEPPAGLALNPDKLPTGFGSHYKNWSNSQSNDFIKEQIIPLEEKGIPLTDIMYQLDPSHYGATMEKLGIAPPQYSASQGAKYFNWLKSQPPDIIKDVHDLQDKGLTPTEIMQALGPAKKGPKQAPKPPAGVGLSSGFDKIKEQLAEWSQQDARQAAMLKANKAAKAHGYWTDELDKEMEQLGKVQIEEGEQPFDVHYQYWLNNLNDPSYLKALDLETHGNSPEEIMRMMSPQTYDNMVKWGKIKK